MTEIAESTVTYTGQGIYAVVVDGETFRETAATMTATGSTNANVDAATILAHAVMQEKEVVTRTPYLDFLSHGDPTGDTVEIRVINP